MKFFFPVDEPITCRAAGFSLGDIGSMFSADGKPSIDQAMLQVKADEIDAMTGRLIARP